MPDNLTCQWKSYWKVIWWFKTISLTLLLSEDYTVVDSSVPFRNAIFIGVIVTERCCFAQLLKVVHSVSDMCFFTPLRKAIRYRVKVARLRVGKGVFSTLMPRSNVNKSCIILARVVLSWQEKVYFLKERPKISKIAKFGCEML